MAKPFYLMIGAGALLLVAATAYLVWLNRSPKVVAPLVVSLAAIVTTAATLWGVLKTERKSDQFIYSIVLRKTDGLPAQLEISPDPKMMFRFQLFSKAQNEPVPDQPNTWQRRRAAPEDATERQKFYLELLQLELFFQSFLVLSSDYSVSSTVTPSGPISHAAVYQLPRTTNFYRKSCLELLKQLPTNRFITAQERSYWSSGELTYPLPVGAELSFPDQQSLKIERQGFYRVILRVEPAGGAGGIPQFMTKFVSGSDLKTTTFVIRMDAFFERLPAENPDVLEAKEWVSGLFNGLKRSMADPG